MRDWSYQVQYQEVWPLALLEELRTANMVQFIYRLPDHVIWLWSRGTRVFRLYLESFLWQQISKEDDCAGSHGN